MGRELPHSPAPGWCLGLWTPLGLVCWAAAQMKMEVRFVPRLPYRSEIPARKRGLGDEVAKEGKMEEKKEAWTAPARLVSVTTPDPATGHWVIQNWVCGF